MTKLCSKCGKEKELTEFYKKVSGKYGVEGHCKICRNITIKLYEDSHKEKQTKYRLDYYYINTEYYHNKHKLWNIKNKEKEKIRSAQYYKTNKSYLLKRRNINSLKRYKTDLNYKIRKLLRNRMYHVLTGKRITKRYKTMDLTGCSIDELKYYLESKFLPGMTWENYGKWHIDHIIPCAFFILTDYQEQKFCFHYTNLQPLWAEDNLKKRDNIINPLVSQ